MVIMILEKVPQALRGELTRWLVEVKTGVYIGHLTGMVRDRLWEKCNLGRKAGTVFQAWSTNTEQKYRMRIAGDPTKEVITVEGLELVLEKAELLSSVKKKRIRPDR